MCYSKELKKILNLTTITCQGKLELKISTQFIKGQLLYFTMSYVCTLNKPLFICFCYLTSDLKKMF